MTAINKVAIENNCRILANLPSECLQDKDK
jgi:hypothetical protein